MDTDSTAITLRAVEPTDVDCLYIWENDPSLWPHGSTRAPLSRFQLSEYATGYDADPYSACQLRLMIETGAGVRCGTIDLYDFDPSAGRGGVGIFVAPCYRRQGIAGKALEKFARYCREMLNMHQLWCMTAIDNVASIALFEHAGFKKAGRLRSWVRDASGYKDVLVMQLMLESVR